MPFFYGAGQDCLSQSRKVAKLAKKTFLLHVSASLQASRHFGQAEEKFLPEPKGNQTYGFFPFGNPFFPFPRKAG